MDCTTMENNTTLHTIIKDLYLSGEIDTNIAQKVNVPVAVVRGICRSPLFQAMVREEMPFYEQAAKDKLDMYAVNALDTLGSTLRSSSAPLKLKISAAKALLTSRDAEANRAFKQKYQPLDIVAIVNNALQTANAGALAAKSALDAIEQKNTIEVYAEEALAA